MHRHHSAQAYTLLKRWTFRNIPIKNLSLQYTTHIKTINTNLIFTLIYDVVLVLINEKKTPEITLFSLKGTIFSHFVFRSFVDSACSRNNPIEDDLVLKVGNRGRNRGEFTNPQGVAMSPDGKSFLPFPPIYQCTKEVVFYTFRVTCCIIQILLIRVVGQ